MSERWDVLVRQYLEDRNPACLDQAIASTSEEVVVALLKAYQTESLTAVTLLGSPLSKAFYDAGRQAEGLTIALLCMDRSLQFGLANFALGLHSGEDRTRALQSMIFCCDRATDLANEFGDMLGFVASCRSAKGTFLLLNRDLDAARQPLEEAIAIYHRLVQDQPQAYEPLYVRTLNNFGNVLVELRELEEARMALEYALAMARRLAQSQPQMYEPDLAMTLSSLGNVLAHLRESTAGWEAYQQALTIYRRLAQSQPEVYLPEVARILNNSGAMILKERG